MPLSIKIDHQDDLKLCVWKVSEGTDYYRSKLDIHEDEISIINELSSRRLLEWLSSRYLLHLMSGRNLRGKFTKDIFGKPHLKDSDHHVSISHSKDLVAVIASKLLVGIDIQYFVEKIYRIRHKFVSENEINLIQEDKMMEALHVIWGAKESLYKAYGKKRLDFKKHILIEGLDLSKNTGTFRGTISKDNYQKSFTITFQLTNKFALVYAKECH